MNDLYFPPTADWLALYPADGVLNNASNEGYPIDDDGDVFSTSSIF